MYHNYQLIKAAICYALPEEERSYYGRNNPSFPTSPKHWPFCDVYWKPTPYDRVRELVKAGALIAAEIDRLQARDD